jgi:four helix bundle protein
MWFDFFPRAGEVCVRTFMDGRNGQNGRAMSSPAARRVFGQHSGYRKLKAYQVAELLYDFTCRFCDRYVPRKDRHHDQMVQGSRSGYQNIAEGSEDSATSKKLEMNLTNVARSSLDELRKDYIKHLARRGLTNGNKEKDASRRHVACARRRLKTLRRG